jgi:uracil-DNA glycosylase family 4
MPLTERQCRALARMGITRWSLRRDAAVRTAAERAPARSETGPPPVAAAPLAEQVPASAMSWDDLRDAVAACRACELHRTRTQAVFGVGNESADWLFIGEAPGAEEDRQGEPFVGRAGQLLNAMLQAAGRDRSAVYIANVLKCRPPGNRDPGAEEAARCAPWLDRQIQLIAPKLIIALGRVAAQRLLGTEAPLGKLRGRVHDYASAGRTVPLIVTYHPAYLLRSPGQKRKAWDDLLLAQRVSS